MFADAVQDAVRILDARRRQEDDEIMIAASLQVVEFNAAQAGPL
ncbi:hypothetical protein ACFWFU_33505 [Streptomyces sp. NPDC060235]